MPDPVANVEAAKNMVALIEELVTIAPSVAKLSEDLKTHNLPDAVVQLKAVVDILRAALAAPPQA